MPKRARENNATLAFRDVFTQPAYGPIRQAMLPHVDGPTLCALAHAIPNLRLDHEMPIDLAFAAELLEASILPYDERDGRAPASVRRWILSHPFCHAGPFGLAGLCLTALQRNCEADILEDIWQVLGPQERQVLANCTMTPNIFLNGDVQRRSFDHTLDFIWRHCYADDAYAGNVTSGNVKIFVKKYIAAGAGYACICTFLERIARKFSFRATDLGLAIGDMYRLAIAEHVMPLGQEIWHAMTQAEKAAYKPVAWSTFANFPQCSFRMCCFDDALPFLEHMFAAHGPCDVTTFWHVVFHSFRGSGDAGPFLAFAHELYIAGHDDDDDDDDDDEMFYFASALMHELDERADELIDVLRRIRTFFPGAVRTFSKHAECRKIVGGFPPYTPTGMMLRNIWNIENM